MVVIVYRNRISENTDGTEEWEAIIPIIQRSERYRFFLVTRRSRSQPHLAQGSLNNLIAPRLARMTGIPMCFDLHQVGHLPASLFKIGWRCALKKEKFRRFVLYSLRHTFLTRLGESGCDTWTLARIAGHSDIRIYSRYVYPSEDAVLAAMSRLGEQKIGHNDNQAEANAAARKQREQVSGLTHR